MILNNIQLKLMEHSDKTLKFWCIVYQCNRYTIITAISDDETYYQWQTNMIWSELYDKDDEEYTIFWYKNLWFEVIENVNIDEIIGSPFWRWRICMLMKKCNRTLESAWNYDILNNHFDKNPDLYDKNCLEWDDESSKLVLSFLESLSINK